MKMNDYLIPSNYLSLKVRLIILIIISSFWLIILYLKYFLYDADGVIHLGSVYFIWIFGSFLMDKSIPTAPISIYFEKGNFPVEVMRAIAGGASLLIVCVIMALADWK